MSGHDAPEWPVTIDRNRRSRCAGIPSIHVAEYLTVLPPRATLEAKLHQAIALARSRLRDDRDL
jgi:hypothetical protein